MTCRGISSRFRCRARAAERLRSSIGAARCDMSGVVPQQPPTMRAPLCDPGSGERGECRGDDGRRRLGALAPARAPDMRRASRVQLLADNARSAGSMQATGQCITLTQPARMAATRRGTARAACSENRRRRACRRRAGSSRRARAAGRCACGRARERCACSMSSSISSAMQVDPALGEQIRELAIGGCIFGAPVPGRRRGRNAAATTTSSPQSPLRGRPPSRASRAASTARRLTDSKLSPCPAASSTKRLVANVFVVITSAPAAM